MRGAALPAALVPYDEEADLLEAGYTLADLAEMDPQDRTARLLIARARRVGREKRMLELWAK